ncbi:hypothetical protein DM558_12325 [Entomomonas moraniae]|uniref:VENN motif-containing domain-containing protein n=1 Tax=Entomomonas moraniae TaxID=2213226 RepID=A0A451ENZ7_9GAMM|nr:VENN motif pre-toxin domain-containing protein [Entomomonas moraniae]AZS51506.1 hypothetical protein DM558_12325 [Entomomonas moraniae]
MAGIIKQMTEGNEPAHLMAHAVWGAIVANAKDSNAAAGAIGAATAEGLAPYIQKALYGDRKVSELTEEEKQTITALATIGAGLAGSFGTDGNFASGVAAAETGKNAVENNAISDIAAEQSTGISREEQYKNAMKQLEELEEKFKQENCQGLSEEACSVKRLELQAKATEGFWESMTYKPVLGGAVEIYQAETPLDYGLGVLSLVPGEKILVKIGDGIKYIYTGSRTINKVFVEISVDEIININKSFGGSTTLTGHVDTVLANMSYQEGFFDKAAVAIRDIAGSHLFDNGNKRTAQVVVEQLAKKNNINLTEQQIRRVVDAVGTGELKKIEDISKALQNGK